MYWLKRSLIAVFVLSSFIYGQSFSVGLGCNVGFIQGSNYYTHELGFIGIYPVNGTSATFGGLGAKSIFGASALFRYDISDLPLSFTAEIHFQALRGHTEQDIFNFYLNHQEHFKYITELDIWTLAVGSRYSIPFDDLQPFVSAAFLTNYLGDLIVESKLDESTSYRPDYKNGLRYGFSFGLGTSYSLTKYFDIEIKASYNMLNQFNRREGEEILNTIGTALNIYYHLL